MNDFSRLPIGLFDSGMGGLTVFKALADRLPHEDLLYLGDTARLPYGTKGRDTIIRYTLKAAQKLVDMGVKMLVIACNTATSAALEAVREQFAPLPVMGVVAPGAQAAAQASVNGHIVVVATEATIAGGAYQQAIARIRPEAVVTGRACTLFVPLAEEGCVFHKEVVVLQQQRNPLFLGQVEVDARAGAHAFQQAGRNRHIAHLLAFALHKHRLASVKAAQRVPDQRVKALLCGLGHAGYSAQHRAAVVGQALQVQHLGTLSAQCVQQAGFA